MNLFSRRINTMHPGRSQSGRYGMLSGMIHRFEGTLIQALETVSNAVKPDVGQVKDYPPFTHLLNERARPSIGATQGHMPVLTSNDQNKPYGQALRGLAGF